MDRVSKQLEKLSEKERKKIATILNSLKEGKIIWLDIKKLKGRQDLFRVRSGDLRVIFRLLDDKKIFVLAVERRSEKTYR
ncbi:MAG: type II toxin-antitoxin system RelE/ParE family toxin [Candidatus Brennerbacteria bacterium]|nr:type II toxin-antitoxin system RelE/ParE family toxin [Candidatus Brennerbacteria bacterium]